MVKRRHGRGYSAGVYYRVQLQVHPGTRVPFDMRAHAMLPVAYAVQCGRSMPVAEAAYARVSRWWDRVREEAQWPPGAARHAVAWAWASGSRRLAGAAQVRT